MKTSVKYSKIIVSLILLVVAVLCVINASYSYFTATASKEENLSFGDLNLRFIYRNYNGNDEGGITLLTENPLKLYPATGTIERGKPFQFSLTNGGAPIAELGIQNRSGSCECYIRVWIDAYIVNEDGTLNTTTNYGKYFELPDSTYLKRGTLKTESEDSNNSAGTNVCYYVPMAVPGSDGSALDLGNSLTLKDAGNDVVPAEILGEKIHIFINFDAIQKANGAYLQKFNDEKGYYLGDIYGNGAWS